MRMQSTSAIEEIPALVILATVSSETPPAHA
jgi:hypothetical protein